MYAERAAGFAVQPTRRVRRTERPKPSCERLSWRRRVGSLRTAGSLASAPSLRMHMKRRFSVPPQPDRGWLRLPCRSNPCFIESMAARSDPSRAAVPGDSNRSVWHIDLRACVYALGSKLTRHLRYKSHKAHPHSKVAGLALEAEHSAPSTAVGLTAIGESTADALIDIRFLSSRV